MSSRFSGTGLLLLSLFLIGGSHSAPQGGPRFRTSPVTGTIQVDGVPAESLQVECHPNPGQEIKYPVTAMTDTNGKFSLATYEASDGLPSGSYTLVFLWLEPGIGNVDRLKGAYSDPKKSTHKVTVEAGKSMDLGVIDLSTKGTK